MKTSQGTLNLPLVSSLTLGGRQSKLIVTDYAFGESRLLYSTAQIFFAGIIDGRDVVFFYGDSSQEHEAALKFSGTPNRLDDIHPFVAMQKTYSDTTIISFLPGIEGLITVYDSDTQLVLFADRGTAATFWAPMIAGPEQQELSNFWSFGSNQSILVGGPYLIRDARIEGVELALTGDLKDAARLTLIAPKAIRRITWNGDLLVSDVKLLDLSVFVAQLETKSSITSKISVPRLTGWKYKDSLPEISGSYDDSLWTVADHTSTNIPWKPYYGDGTVLYGCDYKL